MHRSDENPFHIRNPLHQHYGKLGKVSAPLIEKITGLNQLASDYNQLPESITPLEFIKNTLSLYNISVDHPHHELENIPESGPTVIIANHPFGAIEGLVLSQLILSRRQDLKVIANYQLSRIPEIKDLFFNIDPFKQKHSTQRNKRPMLEALRWLKNGGAILVFPAGEVSHWDFNRKEVSDPPWSAHVARMIQKTRAKVVPAYIHGCNSLPFQILGKLHPRIRTLLLVREFLKRKNRSIKVNLAAPILENQLLEHKSADSLIDYLRKQTYSLKTLKSRTHPIALAKPQQELMNELALLSPQEKLCTNEFYDVYCVKANKIPNILYEIGRLREISFRATGEGTGRSLDLDIYDNYYYHLFIWNKQKNEVVGAYRLGLTDEVLSRYGTKGLYTHSLFKYKIGLLNQIGASIELGRSFVRLEYQKEYTPLMLLWKGIGTFVANNPKYRILFGPVSISNDYSSMSRQMMVGFLKQNNFDPTLAKLVKPRTPFRQRKIDGHLEQFDYTSSLDALSKAITQVELDNKGVPILIKQYLKLGGRILGFNVDKGFSNALDALIMVDLVYTEDKVLQRYMGRDGLENFRNYYNNEDNNMAV